MNQTTRNTRQEQLAQQNEDEEETVTDEIRKNEESSDSDDSDDSSSEDQEESSDLEAKKSHRNEGEFKKQDQVNQQEELTPHPIGDDNNQNLNVLDADQKREISLQMIDSKRNLRKSTILDEMSPGRKSRYESFGDMRSSYVAPEQKKVIEENKPLSSDYKVYFGDQDQMLQNKSKPHTNKVRTQRYSALTWAPLSLLYQFKRIANIYFLFISVLTCLPFSPKDPSSMIGTFALDYQRYKQDKEVNNKLANVLNPENMRFEMKKWEQIEPGNIVKFKKDQEAPADILILYTSNKSGVVYVDTMNLDGETNLKEKNSLIEDFDEKRMALIQGETRCEPPNENLDKWEARITFKTGKIKPQNASIKNLLLRGCFVRNTNFGIGIVIYTGMNTKIMKNLKKPPHKVSNIMRLMNKMLYSVFIFQIVLILAFAGANYQWVKNNFSAHHYLNILLVFWVAYSHMIPISLYVIIEILKLGSASFVNKDLMMYDHETESFALCRNSDLIEELGQVEMVFSDKTGTLTQNKMIFKKCQINGIKYGEGVKDEEPNEEGMFLSGIRETINAIKEESDRVKNSKDDEEEEVCFVTAFFQNLALCNTVMCERETQKGEIQYKASSPDELALAKGASFTGLQLISREHNRITIQNLVKKEKLTFKIIAEFPFDSVRKRMSVILKDENKNYKILTKGADSVMLDRINYDKNGIEGLREIIEHDLYTYSCEGLRTLMIAERNINSSEYQRFKKIYNTLLQSNSLLKDQKLFELYDAMESKLRYLGCTAIEDKLQEGVPMTIEKLMEADIRFFMLTGDKLETAVEIAKSCRVIQDDMNVIVLCNPKKQKIFKKLQDIISIQNIDIDTKINSLREVEQVNQVLTIDGSTLALVLVEPDLNNMFFHVAVRSKSIVCCRMSPLQKAEVVQMFKSRGKWITLAIGDGANDVSMIMEAHIGVGIKGKEGTQAVRSADFAISQFQYLLRLLLYHGRYGYLRVSQMICYYFYKNIILVFTELYFAIYNQFSGQIFFADWLPMLYNAIFTSWCCLFSTLLEKDVNEDYSYKYPVVYKAGQLGLYFNYKQFWKWIVLAIWHGVVCYFGPLVASQFHSQDGDGHVYSHWLQSTISFTIIIHLVLYKLLIETRHLNLISIGSGVLSIVIFYAFLLICQIQEISLLIQPQLLGVFDQMVRYPYFWLMLCCLPLACLVPDLIIKLVIDVFYPSPIDIVLLYQKDDPHYNFRLHHKKQEMKQEIKRKQTIDRMGDRKVLIEDKMKSSKISVPSKHQSIVNLDHFTEVLQEEEMQSQSSLRRDHNKSKVKYTSDIMNSSTNSQKYILDRNQKDKIIEEREEEDEQTSNDNESSSSSSESDSSESDQNDYSNIRDNSEDISRDVTANTKNKSRKKKRSQKHEEQKLQDTSQDPIEEKSSRSIDMSMRSNRSLIDKKIKEKNVKNIRDEKKKSSESNSEVPLKSKKTNKLKPAQQKFENNSIFSVSDVISKIDNPHDKSVDPNTQYLTYFEDLNKDMQDKHVVTLMPNSPPNKNKKFDYLTEEKDKSSNEKNKSTFDEKIDVFNLNINNDDNKQQKQSKKQPPSQHNSSKSQTKQNESGIKKEVFKNIVMNRSPNVFNLKLDTSPIKIPKSNVVQPGSIVDQIQPVYYKERPITVNPSYMQTIGHPLESTSRSYLKTPPNNGSDLNISNMSDNRSSKKKKKYVDKYKAKMEALQDYM